MPVTHFPISVPDAATYTVKAQDAGLSHYIPDLTASCTITLPTPDTGMWFDFVYAGIAADAQDWVIDTGSNTNYYVGGLMFCDQDGDALAPIAGDGNSNSKLTVVKPEPGTRIRVESANGTTWTLSGYVLSATIPSFADQ
jgi:hypothetical protein